jgi:enolase-phosphatase E1
VLRSGVFPSAAVPRRRVTVGLRDRAIRSVLLDIEGTTTPIAFVYDVLFPYARANVDRFLRERFDSDEVRPIVERLWSEWRDDAAAGNAPPPQHGDANAESICLYVVWLMDCDRKSPGLKALQGLVWEAGYRTGLLRGEVFDDVPRALARWREAGIEAAIYSSGSVLAQKLLFETTRFGDLTRSIDSFFDTRVGAKQSPDSYTTIADALGRRPAEILFVSDAAAELAAARAAGCQAALAIRTGNPAQQTDPAIPVVHSFDEITE